MTVSSVVALSLIALVIIVFKIRAEGSQDMKIARFAPVPNTPNCVSSEAVGSDPHFIEPLKFTREQTEAKAELMKIIDTLPRTHLVSDDQDYLHYEFRTAFFKFVDDVEFRFDTATKTIRVRSASRVGRSDLGVNRKRIEEIRKLTLGRI